MNSDEPQVFVLPFFPLLAITGLWLIAGNLFFVDQWMGAEPADWDHLAAQMRVLYAVEYFSTATQGWMVNWTALWPQELSFSFRSLARASCHPFLHTSLLGGFVSLVALLSLGYMVEYRNGARLWFGVVFWAWLVEIAVVWWLQLEFPVFGSWPIIAALATSLLCAGLGEREEGTGLGFRIVGLIVLVAFYLQWPLELIDRPVSVHQWLPSAGFAALSSFTSWFWKPDEF